MSLSHEQHVEHMEHAEHEGHAELWLDTYWPALVITFAITFVAIVITCHPVQ